MKSIKIIYWITTAFVGLMMIYSAYAYLTQPMMTQAFHHLGYPDYFRVELAIAKLIGGILLLVPLSSSGANSSAGVRLKEWVYAGFVFTLISAFIAHSASGDTAGHRSGPIIFLVLLAISYFSYHRLHQSPKVI
jgi:di/tricarboxylate transporter